MHSHRFRASGHSIRAVRSMCGRSSSRRSTNDLESTTPTSCRRDLRRMASAARRETRSANSVLMRFVLRSAVIRRWFARAPSCCVRRCPVRLSSDGRRTKHSAAVTMRKINTRNYRLATRATPREVNRRIVLNLIREHQPISRAELARRMNVRRAALTAIIRDLLEAGEIYETGTAVSVRGRRPTMIRVRTSDRLALAVDVRPGRTSVALADFGGSVLERGVFETPSDPEELVYRLAAQMETV